MSVFLEFFINFNFYLASIPDLIFVISGRLFVPRKAPQKPGFPCFRFRSIPTRPETSFLPLRNYGTTILAAFPFSVPAGRTSAFRLSNLSLIFYAAHRYASDNLL